MELRAEIEATPPATGAERPSTCLWPFRWLPMARLAAQAPRRSTHAWTLPCWARPPRHPPTNPAKQAFPALGAPRCAGEDMAGSATGKIHIGKPPHASGVTCSATMPTGMCLKEMALAGAHGQCKHNPPT